MPCLSIEARRRVVSLHSIGYSVSSIFERLEQENVEVSKRSIYNLLKKFRFKGVIRDLPKRKKARILTKEMEAFIEEQLKRNDELTSTAINTLLRRKWPDLRVSASTIKRVRREIGWVCTRPHYCQLIREVCMNVRFEAHVPCIFINLSTKLLTMHTKHPFMRFFKCR